MRIETPCQGLWDESRADAVFGPSVRQTETSGRPEIRPSGGRRYLGPTEIRSSGGQSRLDPPGLSPRTKQSGPGLLRSVRRADEAVLDFLVGPVYSTERSRPVRNPSAGRTKPSGCSCINSLNAKIALASPRSARWPDEAVLPLLRRLGKRSGSAWPLRDLLVGRTKPSCPFWHRLGERQDPSASCRDRSLARRSRLGGRCVDSLNARIALGLSRSVFFLTRPFWASSISR
jgi:hypothetical protein